MPIPKPRSNESESDFISRCMGDEVMNEDYPDQDIRAGVCYTQWENRNKGKAMDTPITVPFEIKALNDREFEGYGSFFGNVDYGGDIVLPGAFEETLKEHKAQGTLPAMFWMHKPDQVPGKWLHMEEDSQGLFVKGTTAKTQLGDEARTLLNMKAVRGLSIGYETLERDWDQEGNRLLRKVSLFETSIVSLGMNPLAQITHAKTRLSENGIYVPKDDEIAELKRDIGRFIQTKGFSRRAAMAVVGELFKGSTSVTPDNLQDPPQPCATPDEIEVNAGLSDFKEKLLLQDLDRALKEIF